MLKMVLHCILNILHIYVLVLLFTLPLLNWRPSEQQGGCCRCMEEETRVGGVALHGCAFGPVDGQREYLSA